MFKPQGGHLTDIRREIPAECRTIFETIMNRTRHPCWDVDPDGHDGEYCVYVFLPVESLWQNLTQDSTIKVFSDKNAILVIAF